MIHVLRDCMMVTSLWVRIIPQHEHNKFFTLSLREWLICNLQKHQPLLGENPWSVVFGLACWHLWKWRNSVVFNAISITTRNCLSLVRSMATATTTALADFDGVQVERGTKEKILIRWRAPQAGWLSLNTDGAYKKSTDEAAVGGVIRNSVDGSSSGFDDKLIPCANMDLIRAIKGILQNKWEVHLVHIYREGNMVADYMAKYGFDSANSYVSFEYPPPGLRKILMYNMLGVCLPRMILG
ncbi:Ribonuclease H-like protein [Theobroma cacao]|uniref:Ribonuclease H-like protein n=1 Tax=Theobroma cacao TaxID=3641 RepID=A0A061FNB8_THECC|nr:Ribonuclease H-like protein [Theobroma cacao]